MRLRTLKLPGAGHAGHLMISAPKALLICLERNAVVLTATTAAVVIAVVYLRRRLRTAALRHRVSYDLLPTTSFDPSAEDILRFARQLQRARLAAPGWTPRAATAVRVRLYTNASGRLAFRVEGSSRAASALSQQAYAGVELRAADPPAAASAPGGSAPADTPGEAREPVISDEIPEEGTP